MIYKCPNCSTALTYNPETDSMVCEACTSLFNIESNDIKNTKRQMEVNIYSCTACGAQLMMNSHDLSTYCAFCGQPNIVFSRKAMSDMPDYIIPFSITKQRAEQILRDRLTQGFFVPNEFKEFKPELIIPIYSPYYVYNLHFADSFILTGDINSGRNKVTHRLNFVGTIDKPDFIADASSCFNDELSQRLEPFHTEAMVQFEPAYLSGYYAEDSDITSNNIEPILCRRLDENLLKCAKQTCKEQRYHNIQKSSSNYQLTVNEVYKALFPAWFFTIRYEGITYTMLVNGQTGKLVGTAPINKKKVKSCFVLNFIILLLISAFAVPITYSLLGSSVLTRVKIKSYVILLMTFALLYLIKSCKKLYNSYTENLANTTDVMTSTYVIKREVH